jgi:hypothetical protein
MVFFKSLGIVALLIMSNNRARYGWLDGWMDGWMASQPTFRISPEMLSGPACLFYLSLLTFS